MKKQDAIVFMKKKVEMLDIGEEEMEAMLLERARAERRDKKEGGGDEKEGY